VRVAVQHLFPILRTADLPALIAFYESAFGGVVTYRYEEVYAALAVGGGSLGIGFEPDASGDQVAIWFYVDDADAAYRAVLDAGGSSEGEPEDMPWGERVATVRDPDGNLLYLGRAAAIGGADG
jgi:uncharacterized glyoxalase superfamily protein PhnB